MFPYFLYLSSIPRVEECIVHTIYSSILLVIIFVIKNLLLFKKKNVRTAGKSWNSLVSSFYPDEIVFCIQCVHSRWAFMTLKPILSHPSIFVVAITFYFVNEIYFLFASTNFSHTLNILCQSDKKKFIVKLFIRCGCANQNIMSLFDTMNKRELPFQIK